MVRLWLAPVTVLFLVFAFLGIRRARRCQGTRLAMLVSVGLGALIILPLLGDLSGRLLYMGSGGFTDTIDSISIVAAKADSLPRLSDVTDRYFYPEGTSWLVLGPSLLGYLVPSLISAVSDPVVGHNLGIGFSIALLALCSWGLARSLGAGTIAALFAAGGAALAPVVVNDIGGVSLDRLTLFLVPLFFLCLHRAAEERSWEWPVAAGVTLAAAFYGQVYYGIYLAVACPLLVIPRLAGPGFRGRLLRMLLVAGVSGALVAPGLYILVKGVEDSGNAMAESSFRETADDLLRPFDPEEVSALFEAGGRGGGNRSMDDPEQRLLAAMEQSISLRTLRSPSLLLAGGSAYWILVLLSVALALAARRRAAMVAASDTLILLIFALGPFLRTTTEVHLIPLPYYLDFLYIPGFEQLKNVGRFAVMAASISSVPLALGLEGAFRRLRARPSPLWHTAELPVVALCVAASVIILPDIVLTSEGRYRLEYSDGHQGTSVLLRFQLPETYTFELPEALQEIEPGPALALPFEVPIDSQISVNAMQAGLSLVNEPPFEVAPNAPVPWVETNQILNDIARVSRSSRMGRRLYNGEIDRHLESLQEHGLRYVVVYRDFLAGPDVVADTEEVLDALFERLSDDGKVAVWEIPVASSGD